MTTNTKILFGVVLALGVVVRFVNLDKKVYWYDEVYTSFRTFGYRSQEISQTIATGRELGVADWLRFQRLDPNRGAGTVLAVISEEEPHIPPLYHVLLRWWAGWFDDSVAVMRMFSVVMSLLCFVALAWLAWELFGSTRITCVALAIMAVSPFHLLYAQEARWYSLWTLVTLLSCAALLRAGRVRTRASWVLYGASVVIAFYTNLFSVLIVLAQTVYVIAVRREDLRRFLGAALAGTAAYLPWFWIMLTRRAAVHVVSDWTAHRIAVSSYLVSFFGGKSYLLFDIGHDASARLRYGGSVLVLLLLGYSIYFVWRRSERRVRAFVLALAGLPAVSFLVADLILGGTRGIVHRYSLPTYVGLQLAVAYLLATRFDETSRKLRLVWRAITVTVFVAGIVSCVRIAQADTWWTKSASTDNPAIARLINQADRPLIITDLHNRNFGNILSLCHALDPKTRFLVAGREEVLRVIPAAADVFVFQPSDPLHQKLTQEMGNQLALIHPSQDSALWRVKR